MKALCTSVLALALVTLASRAPAAGLDPAAADALFREGRALVEKGDWPHACPKFAESQRLDPAPGTLLNLADCEEHLGRLAHALEHWNEAIDALPAGDDRLAPAKTRRDALAARVPRLSVTVASGVPSATVTRDGVELHGPSLGMSLPVDPGLHVIVVTAPQREEARYELTLKEGETRAIEVAPGKSLVAAPPPRPASSTSMRTVGWIAIGAGAAGIVVGSVAGALTLHEKSVMAPHCDGRLCDGEGFDAAARGRTWSTTSTVAFVASGVALATGATLLLLAPTERRVAVAPWIAPTSGGFTLVRRF